MKRRAKTDKIIIHCSATRDNMDIGVKDIRAWHIDRGWSDVGYHFVIRRDGTVEEGRDVKVVGAHAVPWNSRSVGVCLVGGVDENGQPENNFTKRQFESLRGLVNRLLVDYPASDVIGHRDVPGVAKACPSFDVRRWYEQQAGIADG